MRFIYNLALLGLYGQVTLASKRKCHITSRSSSSGLARGGQTTTSSPAISASVSIDTLISIPTSATPTNTETDFHTSSSGTIVSVVSTSQGSDTTSISSSPSAASTSTASTSTASTSSTASTRSETPTPSSTDLSTRTSTETSITTIPTSGSDVPTTTLSSSTDSAAPTTTQSSSTAIESGSSSSSSDGTPSSTTSSAGAMCTANSIQLQGSPSNGKYFGRPVGPGVVIAQSDNTVQYYLNDGTLMVHTTSTSSDLVVYTIASSAIGGGLIPLMGGVVGHLPNGAMPLTCTQSLTGKLTCSSNGLNTFYTCAYGGVENIVLLSPADNPFISTYQCTIATLYYVGTSNSFPCE